MEHWKLMEHCILMEHWKLMFTCEHNIVPISEKSISIHNKNDMHFI